MPFSHPSPTAAVRGRLACAPRRRAVARLAAASLAALLLGGCTSAPGEPPSPTPTASAAEPIFASDEEALAAAVEAYERYLRVSATISMDGGRQPERIREVVTAAYADEVILEFERMRANSLHIQGINTLEDSSLIARSESEGVAYTSIYACVGVGDTRVFNESGQDVTPVGRDDRVPVVISFETESPDEPTRVAGSEPWSGDDFC